MPEKCEPYLTEGVQKDPDVGTDSTNTEVGVWMQTQVTKSPSHVGAEVSIEGFLEGLSIFLGHRSRGMNKVLAYDLVSCRGTVGSLYAGVRWPAAEVASLSQKPVRALWSCARCALVYEVSETESKLAEEDASAQVS
jgi:hypothetical protein